MNNDKEMQSALNDLYCYKIKSGITIEYDGFLASKNMSTSQLKDRLVVLINRQRLKPSYLYNNIISKSEREEIIYIKDLLKDNEREIRNAKRNFYPPLIQRLIDFIF
jgi:hypothetical protein